MENERHGGTGLLLGALTLLTGGLLAAASPRVASGAVGGAAAGVVVRVRPTFGAAPLVLDKQTYATARHETVTISTCRFYLSNLRLTYADGTTWTEPNSYHLVDAATDSTWTLTLAGAPERTLRRLTFSVGVDSAANVAGAQDGDLEAGRGMYWAWHSGFINAKLEGRSPGCRTPHHEFEWHIGGFAAPHNALRTVTLAVPPSHSPATRTFTLRADVGAWLGDRSVAESSTVVVPGPAAMAVADGYARMFSLETPPVGVRK